MKTNADGGNTGAFEQNCFHFDNYLYIQKQTLFNPHANYIKRSCMPVCYSVIYKNVQQKRFSQNVYFFRAII